ncbi:MAG: alpha/beta hydrolase [Acidobacteriota bacterium]
MANFEKQSLKVNGVDVVMLTAGHGPPLLHLHGAGTWHGFDFALRWADTHRVMIPYHPGLGESGDCPEMTCPHDYVMHYLELIDQLKLDTVDLVGMSMGGRLAATFASEHPRRVRRLVLVAPAGLDVAGYSMPDFSQIPPQEVPSYLIHDVSVIAPYLANAGTDQWNAARTRENATFFRLLQGGLIESTPEFSRWLHRLTMPTMLIWGENDRTLPIQQADRWVQAIPGIQFKRIPEAGHLVMDEKPEAVELIGQFLSAR